MSRHGKNNKTTPVPEHSRPGSDYPSREELITQLTQLRACLDGAYEALDTLAPSADPEVIHKVADMVDTINGLHECEFEVMDLLSKDIYVISRSPSRGAENPVDTTDDRLCDSTGTGETDTRSRGASQEDLSLFGAYAVSSSRSHKSTTDLLKSEKSDHSDGLDSQVRIPPQERVENIKRLEEIHKINAKLVERCRRLGLVLRCGFAHEKNFTSKLKEVKDIIAAKEQAQRKISELKVLMQQMSEDKFDSDISLAKIENDDSFVRSYRFESHHTPISPEDHTPSARDAREDENVKKPRSYLGLGEPTESTGAPDYTQFLRGLRQPFTRELGERESAFVPIHNASHMDTLRDKNKRATNLDSTVLNMIDLNNEVKQLSVSTASGATLRRINEKDDSNSQELSQQWEQERHARSSSARASFAPTQHSAHGTLPNNLYRGTSAKSPPSSMQSSSGMGSMNSRSIGSLDGRADIPLLSMNTLRVVNVNQLPEESNGPRGFPERSNISSNNLNKTYRQPTRSSSFYSELDFRNQELPGWDDARINTTPLPSSPFRDLGFSRRLSTTESQQLTEELNRLRRFRNTDETLPQQAWWSSNTDLGQPERHSFLGDHQNFMSRDKSSHGEKPPIGNASYSDHTDHTLLYDQFNINGHRSQTQTDCLSQNIQLTITVQEMSQQLRNLTMAIATNKAAIRDGFLQQRFDITSMSRAQRDLSDVVSESMKRMESLINGQTHHILDLESRLRRIEENQRSDGQKYGNSRERDREWQVPGRPDFLLSQDLQFQIGSREAMRERETSSSRSMLNNQIPPGTRANNYWDNFRSYSRQNMLSKSNANVPQPFSHEASPSSTDNSRYSTSSDVQLLNNTQPFTVSADCPVDSRRQSGAKNLWATSGFYENMSTKKRNKDQKSQSTAYSTLGKSGSNSLSTSSVAEPLRSSHGSQPEPDDTSCAPGSQQPFHSRLTQRRTFRRESDSGPYSRTSDFEMRRAPTGVDYNFSIQDFDPSLIRAVEIDHERGRRLHTSDDTSHGASSHGTDLSRHRVSHLEENNPNSQSAAAKIDREKYVMQNFESRSRSTTEGFISLDDTRSTNQELIDNTEEIDIPDWGRSRQNEANLFEEMLSSSAGEFRSLLSTPLLRPAPGVDDNREVEGMESNDGRRAPSPSAHHNTSNTVPMNIRCEEVNVNVENSLGRNDNREIESNSNNSAEFL